MKKKILIIEDEKTIRFLLSQRLREEGFEVIEVIDGESGLQKLRDEKVDLVLLDIILPGIDGFEVLSKIKAEPSLSSIPVVIMSNLGQQNEIERGLKLGASEFLLKANFTLDEIVSKIKRFLEKE